MTGPWYATLDAARLACLPSATVTAHDDTLKQKLESVSRGLELHCQRWFYPRIETRLVTARNGSCVDLREDLLEITSLKTDADGDDTYEVTWAPTDYRLAPVNARSGGNPEPYSCIEPRTSGSYAFPSTAYGVQVAGKWGYFDLRDAAGTLAEALDTSETGVDMTAGHAVQVGHTLLVGSEQMFVTAVSTNTLTVVRGVNGTTAAAHDTAAAVEFYTYGKITQACLQQVALDFISAGAPGGFRGTAGSGGLNSGDIGGEIRASGGLHPFVRRDLETYKRLIFA